MKTNYKNLSYNNQIALKQQHVIDVFKAAKINVTIDPIIQNDHPSGYRHKVTASATTVFVYKRPKLRLGMFVEGTHDIDPGFNKMIHEPEINDVLEVIEKVLNQYKITAYDLKKRQGILKHVLIRKSYLTKEMLVVFVTNRHLLPNHKKIVSDMRKSFERIKTVIQMIQNKQTPIVLYGEERVLYGPGFIKDGFQGLTFRLSAKSFYQVNPEQMVKLYLKALNMAHINKQDVVMDCYSGIGTISLIAAQSAKSVTAIEVNQTAVKDAIINQKQNNIHNVKFYAEDVELFIGNYNEQVDVLILDPPRTGTTPKFLNAVKKLKPKKIVYISCFVETQVRDMKMLMDLYDIHSVQPVDMFSYTEHVESITLLSLK